MNYWPERVLRKCQKNLAIAHDVEDTFWHEVEVPVMRGKNATGETKLEWQPKALTDDELDVCADPGENHGEESMSFADFFKSSVLEARLAKSQVMVVYDPERRYRDVCLGMASEKREVVDSSESSITSRAQAIADLGKLGDHQIEQLLVYVPAPKPLEDEDKQKDPFALFGVCGDVFPSGDGDNYLSLCLKAKPDHATQVRAVFDQDPNPSFAVIDAIGGGLNWPNLRALLKVESTADILFALLVPSDLQQSALKETDSWVAEAKGVAAGQYWFRTENPW